MNSYIQFICLVGSFLYGMLLNILNLFNIKLIKDKPLLIKIIISILYILNVTLLYILFLYKLNYGVLHIYFILLIIMGYIFGTVKKRK